MLETILKKCDERLRACKCKHTKCTDCKRSCTLDCKDCISKIHFPGQGDEEGSNRGYDCKNMADFYTCRCSCRYASEIVYAIRSIDEVQTLDSLKVLSLGCGPCTDLFAIQYMREQGELKYTSLEFKGVDFVKGTWCAIHNDIKTLAQENEKIDFVYEDMREYIEKEVQKCTWIPNLIIFQYVFSDMKKHMSNVSVFIQKFAAYYNKIFSDCYIILNDINCDKDNIGGRNYFDYLSKKLNGVNEDSVKKFYFDDKDLCDWQRYGDPHIKKELLFDANKWSKYITQPQLSCASAQMIIRKSDTETK